MSLCGGFVGETGLRHYQGREFPDKYQISTFSGQLSI